MAGAVGRTCFVGGHGAVHRCRGGRGATRKARLAARVRTGRGLDANRPRAAVHPDRISLESHRQRVGDAGLPRRRHDPTGRGNKRAWADAGDVAVGFGPHPRMALAGRGTCRAAAVGRRRCRSSESADRGHRAHAQNGRGAGQHPAGPEVEPHAGRGHFQQVLGADRGWPASVGSWPGRGPVARNGVTLSVGDRWAGAGSHCRGHWCSHALDRRGPVRCRWPAPQHPVRADAERRNLTNV